jgi:prostaglandin-endoperoxide synthase 2
MRDMSRDGRLNRFEDYVLSHFPGLWDFVMSKPWLRERFNRFLIDRAAKKGATRPRPFSSAPPGCDPDNKAGCEYTSFQSLMDQRWFSRHLPPKDVSDLPDVEKVVELFKVRDNKPVESKRSTLLFPVFAQWFTDGFLMTDAKDRRRTFTCHQIDLNPLYGLTQEQTLALRLRSEKPGEKGLLKFETINGEEYAPKLYGDDGKVKPEFVALRKPLGFDLLPEAAQSVLKKALFAFGGERANSTPYTSALNTLFVREHNRIARELQKAYPAWDDERVFQVARNINIVLLIKIVVEEYINHIAPQYFKLTADPKVCWKAPWNKPNWVPIEFNLLYRWHSLCPDRFRIGGGEPLKAGRVVFNNAPLLETGVGPLLEAASGQPAWEIGLFNTPNFLHERDVEKNSIQQGRDNHLASYNDYREAFGYPRVKRFEQISDDPTKVAELRRIYGDVDKIEFFVGLFAEPIMYLGALPPLLKRMVAFDAFTLALTNPLLSEHVFNETTFTKLGMDIIAKTERLQDLVDRNSPAGQKARLSMDLAA